MSISIKGMEIPKNCLECMFRISYWKRASTPSGKIFTYGCMFSGKEINILEKRCKDCPIDEIPTPHGRLIDADELLKAIEENSYMLRNYISSTGKGMFLTGIRQAIDEVSTIIEAEE